MVFVLLAPDSTFEAAGWMAVPNPANTGPDAAEILRSPRKQTRWREPVTHSAVFDSALLESG